MATKVKRSLIYIALILLAVICLLPFALMMINATRTGPEIVKSFTLVPGVATLLTSYFSALAAYALVMYAFKGNKVISTTIVIFMMIPGQLSLIGFYDLITNLGMIDTYWPLILPAVASPGVVFFLRQYLEGSLQPALVEAARIDGATEIHIFHKIILPLMSPGIATMAIGAFVGSWNNYLIPLILLNSPDKFTLPVMIASLNSSQDITRNQGAIYLAVAISVIPILIAFAFLSKYIIGSISAGGVKE